MDALPPHDRKEIAKELIETLEADLAQHKKDTGPMEYSKLIQAGVEEGILSDAPADAVQPLGAQADATVEAEAVLSCTTNCEIEIDQNLRHGAACLVNAKKAETRVNDLKLSAQYAFKAAKVAWMEQPDKDEKWSERCARVIPHASQRTVDALISAKTIEDVPSDEELEQQEFLTEFRVDIEAKRVAYYAEKEARIKAESEAAGVPYG
jgi:hypothetical protein